MIELAPPHESGCEMMKRIAKDLEKEIDRTRKRINELEEKIAALKAQTNPDLKEIQALEKIVEQFRKKLEEDQSSLSTLQDVISENC
ncbi:hypothetical protein ACH4U6_16850 [Streptomyces netropsis]|uniref:hypothetical protein n=1 Tax=Streptomyces netropsis TaxID=55404 RepID=UPI0037B83E39